MRDLHAWEWVDDESCGIGEVHQVVHVAQPMLLQHGNEDQGVHYDQNSKVDKTSAQMSENPETLSILN